MSDILRQVDDDLRREKITKLWNKYGLYAILLSVIIIVSVIGYQLNVSISKSKNESLVEKYINAANSDYFIKQIPLYEAVISADNKYLSGLAELKTSKLQIENGNIEEGLIVLEKITENKEYDIIIRDLATYLLLMTKIEDPDNEAFTSNLTKDRIENSSFKYLFLEIIAIRKLILGNFEEAKSDLNYLISNLDLPIEIRNRANKFIELTY